jgi:3-deoxy-D-manno-octulosonic-acid transferase
MKWITYNLLFAFAYTLLLPRFLLRMWRRGGYRRGFLERFACYTPAQRAALAARRRVWIHAVSVGEMFVGLAFLRELRARNPGLGFVLTTTTSTGHALARARLAPEDVLLYVPVDFPWVVRRAVRRIRPLALLLVEGEVWPNLVRRLHREGVPVALVNGRLSARSFAGFARIRPFVRDIYARLALFAAQGRADADRYLALGAPADRVAVLGSAKYDIARADAESARPPRDVLERAGFPPDALLILGGSTWPGEERILLDLFRKLRSEFPAARLVLVPRHAERAAEVEADLRDTGLTWVRRRALEPGRPSARAEVLLVDTTGELKGFYAAATVVFVGKSLTQHGGQNIMEPAALGKPVIVGPNMENFLPVMEDFLRANAVIQVASADELGRRLAELLRDPAARECFADRARRLVRDQSGVIAATADRLLRDIPALAQPSA